MLHQGDYRSWYLAEFEIKIGLIRDNGNGIHAPLSREQCHCFPLSAELEAIKESQQEASRK